MKKTDSKNTVNKRKHKKRILILKRIRFVLIIAVIVYSVWYLTNYVFVPKNVPSAASVATTHNTTTHEVTFKPTGKMTVLTSNSENTKLLKNKLQTYVKNFSGKYGIYYYNLTTGDEFGINDQDEFTAASTVKVPLNLFLYERIKSGAVDLKATLTYEKEDYEEGTGNLQYEDFGNHYNVEELSRLSIVNSDNVATNMLFRYLGIANVKDYMRQTGAAIVDNDQNISCAKDMGIYMKLVYDFYKSDDVLGKKLMDSLLNTAYNDRLPALLPKEVKVAHKIGTQVNVFNDVGIIFADKPYILCVMSKDVDEDEAPDVIANISKKVYDYVSNNS